jgi:hypothetical protein
MNGALWSREWFEFLINTSNGALVSGHSTMDEADRGELEMAIADLREGFALYPAGGEVGAIAAGRMMSASFLIGAYSIVTTSHKNLLVKKPAREKALKPRPKVDERHAAVKAIHDSIKTKMTLERKAFYIKDRLPDDAKLSERQIKRILTKIRKSDMS